MTCKRTYVWCMGVFSDFGTDAFLHLCLSKRKWAVKHDTGGRIEDVASLEQKKLIMLNVY